ncbi:MAG: hypothetical protein A2189_01585 [Paenibacillus sp. RIFOXYA1_FULL_44_5]|nr:MAG: hypothetical protein A2189_01585 [Paenibacillus sp. RIFOXYA1_FULL_44_5]
MFVWEVSSPIGPLVLTASEEGLTGIEFGTYDEVRHFMEQRTNKWIGEVVWHQTAAPFAAVGLQLQDYFAGKQNTFDIPIRLYGTSFQQKVWQALLDIPYGETRTYTDIALAIGSKKAARAVGGACNRNPIPVLVPCHRVVGASGSMVGYAGGLAIKQYLLQTEGL